MSKDRIIQLQRTLKIAREALQKIEFMGDPTGGLAAEALEQMQISELGKTHALSQPGELNHE